MIKGVEKENEDLCHCQGYEFTRNNGPVTYTTNEGCSTGFLHTWRRRGRVSENSYRAFCNHQSFIGPSGQ